MSDNHIIILLLAPGAFYYLLYFLGQCKQWWVEHPLRCRVCQSTDLMRFRYWSKVYWSRFPKIRIPVRRITIASCRKDYCPGKNDGLAQQRLRDFWRKKPAIAPGDAKSEEIARARKRTLNEENK